MADEHEDMRLIEHFCEVFFHELKFVRPTLNGHGKTYEASVLALVYNAISETGVTIETVQIERGIFKMNGAPAKLGSGASYFRFKGPKTGGYYQLRNGIRTDGHRMDHEVDVAIYQEDEDLLNNKATLKNLVLAIECKLYSDASSLKGELRKNLGMVIDLSSYFVQISGPKGYSESGKNMVPYFVTNQIINGQHLGYAQGYDLNPRSGVVAENQPGEQLKKSITEFVKNL